MITSSPYSEVINFFIPTCLKYCPTQYKFSSLRHAGSIRLVFIISAKRITIYCYTLAYFDARRMILLTVVLFGMINWADSMRIVLMH